MRNNELLARVEVLLKEARDARAGFEASREVNAELRKELEASKMPTPPLFPTEEDFDQDMGVVIRPAEEYSPTGIKW
jgi:hypothetical protein